jgi:hypothetical protein
MANSKSSGKIGETLLTIAIVGFIIYCLICSLSQLLVDSGRRDKSRAGNNCDPSYPDVCIHPPPPRLVCADIEYRNFRVIGDDPHFFDGDSDGIGCER